MPCGHLVAPAIFGNVGTLIGFRVGHADAEVLARELMPYSAETLGDLGQGQICVRLLAGGQPGQPFIGKTYWQTDDGD